MILEKTRTPAKTITVAVETAGPEETARTGEFLGRQLGPGDVVALIGGLGSGKTCVAQGICRGLGVVGYVTSPSFVIANEYTGRVPVYHFDLFRVDSPDEVAQLGLEEYVEGPGVCIIEWAEKMLAFLSENRIEVHLTITGETRRRIELVLPEACSRLARSVTQAEEASAGF